MDNWEDKKLIESTPHELLDEELLEKNVEDR